MSTFINDCFIFGAKYLFILSIIIAVIYFFTQSRSLKKNILVTGSISLILIFIVGKIANLLYFNPRPFVVGHFTPLIPHAADNGFPSDHVLLVSAMAAIIFKYNRKIGIGLWIIAVLVAISRVYVGVHHLLDVIASMIIAIVVTLFVFALSKNHQQKT